MRTTVNQSIARAADHIKNKGDRSEQHWLDRLITAWSKDHDLVKYDHVSYEMRKRVFRQKYLSDNPDYEFQAEPSGSASASVKITLDEDDEIICETAFVLMFGNDIKPSAWFEILDSFEAMPSSLEDWTHNDAVEAFGEI